MKLDKLKTCKFPYDTKTITIIYELLKHHVPYDIIRYIWNYYDSITLVKLFDNILQVNITKEMGFTGSNPIKRSHCNNKELYRNNLIYINMQNVTTKFECKNNNKIMIQLKYTNDNNFMNYLHTIDKFMIEKIKNECNNDCRYNLCSQQNKWHYFEIKLSKINIMNTKYKKINHKTYFNLVKNIGMFFKVYIVRNDIYSIYDVIFKIKTIDYIDLK